MSSELIRTYESALEMPVGPLMKALLRSDAAHDFEALELLLTPSFERVEGMTPDDVWPFASTGFDLEHFCFLDGEDASASTDERAICLVEKGDVHVVAPNLLGFLCVVAVAGAHAIGRDQPDAHYWDLRAERTASETIDGEIGTILRRPFWFGGNDFLRASTRLCKLPGVALAERPSEIVRAHPDRAFATEIPETLTLTLPAVEELLAKGDLPRAKRTLEGLARRWLELGDLVASSNWAALKQPIARLSPDLTVDERAELGKRGALPG